MNAVVYTLVLAGFIGTFCCGETFIRSERNPLLLTILRRTPKSIAARFQPTKTIGSYPDKDWNDDYMDAMRRFMDAQAAKRYYYNARVG
ncbi:hypothetical protein QR680_002060 [Steinernema hermaphroditum]|uniref:Uncharacterized protein n=1 Tax=Steinernema hermaphroditum TaxID=289476 RepID=A0AA39H137_9BILA|nr:hypothetical protein QR680_002060 [Steinernema hermaphroditum]